MSENPYAAPRSLPLANSNHSASGRALIYSPAQAACGTIGGPVGLIYFLRANFLALGNRKLAKQTLIFGALLIMALLIITPFLPEKFPSTPITLMYIFITRYVAEKHQMTKQEIIDSVDYDFHSNWRVFGIGLLCLLASIIVLIGPHMLLAIFGIWQS